MRIFCKAANHSLIFVPLIANTAAMIVGNNRRYPTEKKSSRVVTIELFCPAKKPSTKDNNRNSPKNNNPFRQKPLSRNKINKKLITINSFVHVNEIINVTLAKNVTNNLHLGSSEILVTSISRLFDATLVGNVFDIDEHRGLSRQSKQPVQRARKSPASLWKYEQRPLQYSFGLFHEQLANQYTHFS